MAVFGGHGYTQDSASHRDYQPSLGRRCLDPRKALHGLEMWLRNYIFEILERGSVTRESRDEFRTFFTTERPNSPAFEELQKTVAQI